MTDRLAGRRILVTGASSGIGRATARAAATAGAQVALLARREGPLRELADETGGVAVPADVTDVEATLAAVDRAAAVTVSSMSGRRLGSTEMAVYAASKAAVHVVSEGLRRELQPDGIRVTVVAPGFVATSLFDELTDEVSHRFRQRAAEVGLSPEDVARAVVDVLAAPPHVLHVEVALVSTAQT